MRALNVATAANTLTREYLSRNQQRQGAVMSSRYAVQVIFTAQPYRNSHNKEPRGYGSWAFDFGDGVAVFAPSSSYVEAKRWAKERARAKWIDRSSPLAVTISVLP